MDGDYLSILSKVGLTSQESRVYLALLKLQEVRTGKICSYTNIASSNIYKILESLMDKGLVSYRIQNNIKVFMPSKPDVLNELFLEKKKQLDLERKEIADLIVNLKKEDTENPKSNYKYYEGISGVKGMFVEINNIMSREKPVCIYTGKKESYQRIVGFFDEHHKLRQKKGVKERILFPKEDRTLGEKRKNNITEVRYSNLDNEAEWGVVGDVFFLEYISKKYPRAFLIKDEVFAKTFKQVFDSVWDSSNK